MFECCCLNNLISNSCVEVEYMMPFTHFIKLSLTVDFILVNKRQHDPVTDNGTLEG